jgi:hypothetical protein
MAIAKRCLFPSSRRVRRGISKSRSLWTIRKHYTIAEVAPLLGVDRRTISRWKHNKYKVPSRRNPPLPRGHQPTLSSEEQDILAGYAIYGYRNNEPIDREAAKKFALDSFGKDVSLNDISLCLNARGLSSKNIQHYVPQFDCAKFLEEH